MRRRPPRSTRTDTLCPYTTLFRSVAEVAGAEIAIVEEGGLRRFGIVPIAFEIADRADADLAHLPLRERLALFVEDRQVDQWLRRRTGRGRLFEIIFVDDPAADGVGFGEAIAEQRLALAHFGRQPQIGRASGRDKVCQYGWNLVVADT